MEALLKFLRPIIVGLIMITLSGCMHHPPCQQYLNQRVVPKPVRLVTVPPPVPNIIRREYDLCILQKYGVYIVRLGQTWKIVFPSDDLFDNETSEIKECYKPLLNVAADFLQTYHKISVEVAAYSNRIADDYKTKFGTVTDELTTRQAESVAKYLESRDINARLLYAVGRGGHNPVAWNGSPYGRRLNRRVEVSFRYYRNNTAWY